MNKLLLRVLPIVLFLAGSQFSLAQTTTLPSVYGRVLDAQTGEPLRGADISVDFKKSGVSTDSAGRYRLYLPFGEYWKTLDPANRWGGDWQHLVDSNHFEMQEH